MLLHPAIRVVDPAVEDELRRALFQLFEGNLFEKRDRIVIQRAPRHRVQLPEQTGRVVIPAPPQVLGERTQPLMCGGDELLQGLGFADDGCELGAGGHQQPHYVLGEHARLNGLDHEHALKQSAINQGHAQK